MKAAAQAHKANPHVLIVASSGLNFCQTLTYFRNHSFRNILSWFSTWADDKDLDWACGLFKEVIVLDKIQSTWRNILES
jgi:hypothetical protein